MRILLVLLTVFALSGCGRSGAESSRISVRLAIGGRAALDFMPVYLAHALGHFRAEGLSVELQDFPGTSKAMQAMLDRRESDLMMIDGFQ
jgi:NitT/TauT family transport system substrate-binding protein